MKLREVARKYNLSLAYAGLRADRRHVLYSREISSEMLKKLREELALSWVDRHIRRIRIRPFFIMDSEFVLRALDVYAFELLEYSKTVEVLEGDNPFTSITVDHADIKREIEHELRGIVMKLTSLSLTIKSSRKIENSVLMLYDLFDRTLRAILWTKNETPQSTMSDLLKVEQLINVSLPELRYVLQKVRFDAKQLDSLIGELKLLLRYMDRG